MAAMDSELIKALQDQIQREHAASVFYRQAYHWFEINLYPGTAAFFKVSESVLLSLTIQNIFGNTRKN